MHRLVLVVAVLAGCSKDKAAPEAAPKTTSPPSTKEAPAVAPPTPSPAAIETVRGKAIDVSPRCGKIHPFERDHWAGDRPPWFEKGVLHGCHFIADQERETCWSVDLKTLEYRAEKERVNRELPGSGGTYFGLTEISSPEGPPMGWKAATHKHGEITIKLKPESKSFTVCKAKDCSTFEASSSVEQAMVSADGSLLIGIAENELVGVDVATRKQLWTIKASGPEFDRGIELRDGLLIRARSTGTQVIEERTVFDARTGEERCKLGRPGYDYPTSSQTPSIFSVSPTRWLVHIQPVLPPPADPTYADIFLFQDPTTCKVLGTLESPIRREENLPPATPGQRVQFAPVVLQTDTGFAIAYPGGTIALVDGQAMKVTKIIEPPDCPR